VLQIYRIHNPDKHIVLDRSEDKLYDVLKAQIKDKSGWFHVLHRQHKRMEDRMEKVREVERRKFAVELAEQAARYEAELAKWSTVPTRKEMRARMCQIVRGG
jgi:hypothetical protein